MNDQTMQALVLEGFQQNLQLREVPKPRPQKGQVLVQVKASGVNPLDLKIKAGEAAHAKVSTPAILGLDMAGIVAEVGEGITKFKPGDEVYGAVGGVGGNPGTLAAYIAADAELLAHKPRNLSFREAAALPLTIITAWEGLIDRAKVKAGNTVLVQGAAGGVGNVVVQLARYFGAKVWGTIAPDDAVLLENMGGIPIDYTKYAVADYVQEYTAGEGFDIVYDTVGGAILDASFQAAKVYTGHVLSILGWGTHNLAPLSFRGATYSGVFTLRPLLTGLHKKHHGDILQQATAIIEAGALKPYVDGVEYSFSSVQQAYEALEKKTARGKVVISVPHL
ncbi:NADPH:quinone reductase [Chitinophaga rupis]|uniref:NADPH:quinone reductase n=1 Tax=Chitinophaga rupis TaxID=573321 RepID=A0A1H7T2E8_9BACT|nr:zinc-dependent alcohol dehydrogenase family protein [Chitinophaga rupis]SEL78973.1 NADPH:quinone reductase [Chitinophaga rupis]